MSKTLSTTVKDWIWPTFKACSSSALVSGAAIVMTLLRSILPIFDNLRHSRHRQWHLRALHVPNAMLLGFWKFEFLNPIASVLCDWHCTEQHETVFLGLNRMWVALNMAQIAIVKDTSAELGDLVPFGRSPRMLPPLAIGRCNFQERGRVDFPFTFFDAEEAKISSELLRIVTLP